MVAALALLVIGGGMSVGLGGCTASRSSGWAQTAPAIPPVRHSRTDRADRTPAGARADSMTSEMHTASPARN